jgi:hypothetical protein
LSDSSKNMTSENTTRLIVLAVLCSFWLQTAFGCTCIRETFADQLDRATVVARVRILSGPWLYSQNGMDMHMYVASVESVMKDESNSVDCSQIIFIRTSTSSASCGYMFMVQRSYLLAASAVNNAGKVPVLDTGLCSGNALWCQLESDQMTLINGLPGLCEADNFCTNIPFRGQAVCATCEDQHKHFKTGRQACEAGYYSAMKGPCIDCHEKCAKAIMTCFWGTPRCCINGQKQCPSGSPKHPTYSCQECPNPRTMNPSMSPRPIAKLRMDRVIMNMSNKRRNMILQAARKLLHMPDA